MHDLSKTATHLSAQSWIDLRLIYLLKSLDNSQPVRSEKKRILSTLAFNKYCERAHVSTVLRVLPTNIYFLKVNDKHKKKV